MLARTYLSIAAALTLAGCSAANEAPAEPPPLEGAAIGGDFTLTGETGEPVSFSDFDGQYRTIYFGYTYCPDVCPVDVQRAMAGLKLFEQQSPELAARIQPIFVGVDTERDTPEVLTEFTDNFHPRLIGVTGDEETLTKVAQQYAASFSKGEETEAGGYLVNHTNVTLLFGPNGEPLATLPTDQGPEAVAAELEKWVR
ncbi:SCO family protein [Qipengyuania sp. XHP0207]|uniref:SCO family protein n=1 Tax=Qipengyuania sp. XHP0207 TaxID=3038078 RepID=UPI002420452E|nr:SCO family protein [Qipengyuania sp. XHP0207]MDG5746788.1 SCO family protein [Qipengyuania sp. XHP0207]